MQVQKLSNFVVNKRLKTKSSEKDVGFKGKVLSEMEIEKNTRLLYKISKDVIGIHGALQEEKLKLQEQKRIFCEKQAYEKVIHLDSMGSNEEEDEIGLSKKSSTESKHVERLSTGGCNEQPPEAGGEEKRDSEYSFSVLNRSCKKERIFAERNISAKNNHKEVKRGDKHEEKSAKVLNSESQAKRSSNSKFIKIKGKLKSKCSIESENKPANIIKNVSEPELLKARSNCLSSLISPCKESINEADKKLSGVEKDKYSELAKITGVKGNYTCSTTKTICAGKRKCSLPLSLPASARVTKHRTMSTFRKQHAILKDFTLTSPNKHCVAAETKPSHIVKAGSDETLQAQPDFQFISEELNFLNAESGKLATQIHKSDKEKRLDRKRKGMFIRNMLKKKKIGTKKYKRPEKLEKRSEPPLSDSTDSSDIDLQIDSSSDFEFEMDRRLEENARKNNLSVMNVKSILHTVITNEHVVAMMNNTLKCAGEVEGELSEAVYEPKMTRSKIKEVLEKSDCLTPWLLSSTKTKSESKVSILDIPFNEDEDDADYNPEKDVTAAEVESDDDIESVSSSFLCSPSNSHLVKSPVSQVTEEQNMSLTEDDDEKKDDETEETIARRTRSKLPLHDMSLMELEASFVAPDITEDMYDTECNDEDWQDFLKSLTKSEYVEDTPETLDDEANDPEYNYLAEAEQECLDDEDFRDDRMVRVTKKELYSLLDELFNDEGNEEEEETVIQPGPLMNVDFSASGQPSNLNIMVTTDQEAIIREQIKQHVQLLTQMILLTQNQEEYIAEHSNALQLLNEMHRFSKNSLAGERSVFRVCNLDGSLQLIEAHKDETFAKKNNSKEFTVSLQNLFSNNSCFLYPQLLPTMRMITKKWSKDKCTFFPSQDYLLGLGFEQFRHFPSYMMCKCISQLLLPCKTEKQIRTRIKNLRSKRAKDNPVKSVQLTKKLPDDFPHATLTCIQEMIAPKDNASHPNAPSWLKKRVIPPSVPAKMQSNPEINKNSNSKKKSAGSKQKKTTTIKVGTNEEVELLFPDTCVKSLPPVVVMQTEPCPVPADKLNHSHSSLVAPAAITFSSPPTTSISPECVQLTTPPKSSPQQSNSSKPVMVVTSSINAIATVATQILSTSPLASASNPHFISEALAKQQELQKTPTKNLVPVFKPFQKVSSKVSPSVYKPLAPKPLQISPPAFRQVSPFLEKKRSRPRRQELQQKARLICPKGFIIKPHISPINRAAYGLRKRATRSPRMTRNSEPRTILPKNTSPSPSTSNACCNLNSERLKNIPNISKDSSPLNNVFGSTRSGSNRKNFEDSLPNSATKDNWQNQKSSEKNNSCSGSGGGLSGGSGPNLCQQDESNLSLQNGDSHIEDLMAASSTINSNLKRSKDTRTKAQKRNDIKLAMLAPNLIEKDPRRDHRDTIFAQAYLTKVKQTLKNDMDRYEKFLKILFEFGKSDHSPVVLYKSLSYLLSDYPELIHDLAGFLSPEHALQCGCYNTTMDFLKARNFLRKIEIIFEKHPSQYQKVLRIFAEWQHKSSHKEKELYDMLLPMFKGQDQLLAEFSGLFGFHSPPESHTEDFEEVVLDGTDPDFTSKLTGFEDVELPDEANRYGLPGCPCQCHKDKDNVQAENQGKKKKNKKLNHCSLCGLTVKDGKLYFKMPGKWKQARATFFEPFDLNSPEKEPQPEEPNFLPAELKTIIKQPPSSSSSSISCSSSNVCTGASSMIDPSKSVPYSTHCSVKSTFNTIEISKPLDQQSFIPLKDILDSSINAAKEIKAVKFWPNSSSTITLKADDGNNSNSGGDSIITPQTTAMAMVTEISSGSCSDILAKAWEQAGKSPAEGAELDDNLMQELLQIPVPQENLEKPSEPLPTISVAAQIEALPAVGPSMPTDFLLPRTSEPPLPSPSLQNASLIATARPPSTIVLPPLTVASQSPLSAVTVLPLSSVTLIPHAANSSNVQTVNINNKLTVGRHIVHSYPRQNGISLNRNVISKSRTRLSPKGKKEATLNSIMNMAMGKRNQQILASPVVLKTETASPKSVTAVKLQCAPETVERWTKIMDKLILDTTKDHGATSQVFEFLSTKIQGKTPDAIKTRYTQLLQYLEHLKR